MTSVDRMAEELPDGLADEIAQHEVTIGHPASVEQLRPGWWRVTYADTARVRCTVDYAAWAGGGSKWLGSELWVDGVRRFLANGPEGLAALLRDPDGHRLPAAEVHYATADEASLTVPAIVRHHLNLLARRIAQRPGGVVVAERDLPDEWRVRATVGDDVVVLLFFVAARRRGGGPGGWAADKETPFLVFADGVAATIPGGMPALLALLARKQPPPEGHPKVPGAAAPSRQGSVEIRRASVIRV